MPSVPANRLLPSLRRAVLGRKDADRTDGQLLAAFVSERDPDAFAGLVRRHGPMVLGVCRRVVGDAHIAEDSFQAVFIVLARRAAAVRPREQVGNWLYGVAYRTALRARAVLARRRSREKQVPAMPESAVTPPDDVWSGLQTVIDEELNRLPDRLRVPVVLCDLEGRPQRAVAAQLNLPLATLATRLASARRVLADRLTRRGIALSGGALASLLGDRASAAVVPLKLSESVVQTAEAVALGVPDPSLVSAHAVQLSEGVMRMMLVAKLKTVGVAVLSALAVTGGFGFGLLPAQAGDEPAVRVLAVKQPDAPPASKPVADHVYLNRLSLDLRGTPATVLEQVLFAADPDPNKRAKVVEWFLAAEDVKAFLAKKFNVKPDAVLAVKAIETGGKATVIVSLRADTETDRAIRKALAAYPVQDLVVESAPTKPGVAFVTDGGSNTLYFLMDQSRERADLAEWLVETELRGAQPRDAAVQLWTVVRRQSAAQKRDDARAHWIDALGGPVLLDESYSLLAYVDADESDAAFLKRAVTSARGTPPTALEEKYFTEDRDPRKREKLLDALLKDPAVAKKVGDDWKKQMLTPDAVAARARLYLSRMREVEVGNTYRATVRLGDAVQDASHERLAKLVDALLAAKKPDDQMLDGIALSVIGRLPTESEKSLTLAGVAKAPDRKAAWLDVVNALAGTDEAKKHADALQGPTPVPPARP